jgi:hypothetical protein
VPFVQVAITSNTVFSETARNDHQSLYYVRAQDAQGNLSRPSNFVGAPSKTAAVPVDATPPEITPVLSSPSNAAGWHNTPVTVSWSIADVETGVASRNGCEPVTLSSDTAGVTLTCHASNGRGLAATGAVAVKLDVTPPSIQATRNVPPNARGWANTDVTVMFAASDALSRLASVSGPVTLTSEGANQTVTGIAVDGAGNRAVASAMISIDKTPPEASLRFNPITRDLAALGRDSLSGVGAAGAMAPAVVERGFWGRRDDDDDENDEQEGRRWHNRTQRRTYRVVDNAGNAVSLRVDVRRDGTQAKGELLTVQYGDGPRLRAPENRLRFDWSLAKKSGALDTLEQSISVDEGRSRYVAHALYDARTNETRMRVSRPKPRQRTVFAGLVLLRLETLRGKTDVEFGEER